MPIDEDHIEQPVLSALQLGLAAGPPAEIRRGVESLPGALGGTRAF
jgi:hypothetical protein